MSKSRTVPWFSAALLTCIGAVGSLCPVLAQSAKPHNPVAPQPLRPVQSNIVEHVFNIPGRGPVKMRFLRLPPSAVHKVSKRIGFGPKPLFVTRGITANTDPILYTTMIDFTGDNQEDPLWTFPTIGQDPNNVGTAYGFPNTLETNAPTTQNTADISYAMMGRPALITAILADGGMADATTNPFTPQAGDIFIIMFDGVDQNNKPVFGTNSATLKNPDASSNKIDGYTAHFDASGTNSGFATWEFDMIDSSNNNTPNPYVITDTQGRFGLLIAKTTTSTTSSTNVQWIGTINSPQGPNDVYEITNGDFTTAGRVYQPSDPSPSFNQGAALFGTFNYFFELHGTNSDSGTASVGTIEGNIRRRGVNVPAPNTPEAGPGFYTLIASNSSGNVVRQDYFFTQPSYDANGNLIVNYKLEGYPAGTYKIEIRQMPVVDASGNTDTIWPTPWLNPTTTSYPFADFIPAVQSNVTVSNGSATTLNARLERLGDIAGLGSSQPDGVVDVFDLNRLINSFDLGSTDSGFDPAADLVGQVDPTTNPLGLPDGFVDVFDLNALILELDQGNPESP